MHARLRSSVTNVFREWEKVIFPNSDSSFVGEAQGMTSGLKTAMKMLDADESESVTFWPKWLLARAISSLTTMRALDFPISIR